MAETLLFWLLILSFFIIAYIIIFFTTTKTTVLHLPPSPPAIPLIGHLHLLTPSLYKSFHSISIKHGPLLHLRLGPSRGLLLVSCASSAASIFKANDLAFSSRPTFAFADRLPYGTSGFVTAPYGPYWRFMKKLCMTELLSGRQLEWSTSIRRDEIEHSVKRVIESAGVATAVNLGAELMKFTNNVTCRMAMSTRCSEKCEDAEKIRKLVKESFELAAKLCFGDVLGPFKELTFWIYGKQAMDVSRRYDELLEKVLKEHEDKRSSSHRNGDENERDIMDILLDVYHDDHADFKITRTHIKAFFLDLFIGGTNTSAEAMQWTMAELLNHPEAFHKVRNEIESVTQNVRLVEESDIPNMPYLQAVVKETLRLYPPGPVTTRECNQDCKINVFDIPAKTAVAINLYAIMRDPEIWEDPNEFHPERFLKEKDDQSSDHDHVYQNDAKRMEFNFVPFGAGRRGCPGTALAYYLMNTAVAAMVQCFDWKIGEDGKGEKVDMQSGSGMSLGMVHPLICIPVVHFNPYYSTVLLFTAMYSEKPQIFQKCILSDDIIVRKYTFKRFNP